MTATAGVTEKTAACSVAPVTARTSATKTTVAGAASATAATATETVISSHAHCTRTDLGACTGTGSSVRSKQR